MLYTHLITPAQLQALQASGAPLKVFDVSFDLADPAKADALFAEQRIAGATLAHLERDLSAGLPHSATAQTVSGGRHPLPTREALAAWLTRVGFTNAMQAVVYDRNGVNYCGRLWWMLKWAGHDAVAVLDGGLQAWQAAGGATESGPAPQAVPAAQPFALRAPLRQLADTQQVLRHLDQPDQTLIDARGAPRYRGDAEPLDPPGGHIPGALNRPFPSNFGADGRYKSPEQLKTEWAAALAGHAPSSVVHYCGSGVSALANVLAMEVAGYPPVPLYAGSWSEWSRTPGLPCAKG
ncbi:MAG: sulfurtransferase [Burkholderiaceae bacterium]|jgi:thiosulfate/3-mercaptopyruvate sulfurtransferase|nr:sulfurtransferase [Burkholderiaceae bacterium]